MIPTLARIMPALQLTRIALVFTAISNIWLVTMFSHAHRLTDPASEAVRELPLWALLACTAAVAVGMYVFGMALNDVMDARHDRTFAPTRPLPSGRIGFGGAIAIAVAALLLAVAGSVPLGPISTMLTLVCAALVLFYDAMGKNFAGTGVLTLGLIRAVHMLIANPALGYGWLVWLTMSHVIGLSAAGYRLEGKRPPLVGRSMWMVVGGWAFVTVAMLAWMDHRNTLALHAGSWLWVGPAIAVVVFILVALRTVRRAPTDRAAGGLLMKRGLLWLIVYDAAWLASDGLWWQAALIASLLGLAFVSMTLMRHLSAALQETPGFRRDPAPSPRRSP